MKGGGGGRGKCLGYVAIFIVFQIIVITVLALTVLKVKGPKVRFQTATVENFNTANSTAASFSGDLVTKFAVKNPNFGEYKYPNSTVSISYEGQVIGTATVPSKKAGLKKTKRTDITISVDSSTVSGTTTKLSSDINAGVVPLTSACTLNGKVEMMKIIKKKKSGQMSCTMSLNLKTKTVDNLKCK